MTRLTRLVGTAFACALLASAAAPPAQAAFTTWTGNGSSPFQDAEGIAGDGLGNSYVVENSQGMAFKFGPTGNLLTQVGLGPGMTDGHFDGPRSIAVDPATGDVFVGDNNRYQRFDSSGLFEASFSAPNCVPLGIAVAGGNVYL